MAGKGTRTSELGMFKPFIRVNGFTILEWLLLSLSVYIDEESRFVFVTTKAFQEEFSVREKICNSLQRCGLYAHFDVVEVDQTPQGPAKSVYLGAQMLKGQAGPVTIVNVDQYIHFELGPNSGQDSGFLPVYAEFSNKASYVEVREKKILRVVEKNNISNIASAGVYGVSSVDLLIYMLDALFRSEETVNGEYYVGPAYNFLIKDGISIYPTSVLAKFDLGNLSGISLFKRRLMFNSNLLTTPVYSVF